MLPGTFAYVGELVISVTRFFKDQDGFVWRPTE